MHELSICQSIADIVTPHAEKGTVRTINLQVGQLRQIVPDTLVYCWSLISENTLLDGAELNVESIPATVRCADCDHVSTLEAMIMRCEECACTKVSIVTGEEFLITSLELAEA